MDKGPHIISLKPGGVPPVIHVSEGEFGDKIRLYFKLLDTDGTFYNFMPRQDGTPSNKIAGYFSYTRPDGESGTCTIYIYSQTIYILQDGRMYADPNTIVIRGIPAHLTAIPGDVVCEIRAIDENDGNKFVGYTENFIVRVEKKPSAVETSGGGGGGTGGETPGEDSNELSWTNIKRRAMAGTLKSLLSLGQEVNCGEKINIAGAEYPLVFQVVDLIETGAVFDLKYIVLTGSSESSGLGAYDNYLSDELKNVVSKGYHPSLRSGWYWNAADSGLEVPNYYHVVVPGQNTPVIDVDRGLTWEYYKTEENRVKTSVIPGDTIDGWVTKSKASDVPLWRGDHLLMVTNQGYIGGASDVVGYTVCFQIDNTNESNTDPHYYPEWSDVKRAAQNGTLKSSSLQVGQLMPELPTVGVLRCVHIEDNWAAFDQTVLKEKTPIKTIWIPYNDGQPPEKVSLLTEGEKNIFTVLESGHAQNFNYAYYAQGISGYNLGYASSPTTYNVQISNVINALRDIRFAYYEDNDSTKRIKNNQNGTPVKYWGGVGGTGSQYSAYIWNENGGLATDVIGNSGRNPEYYVNPVFVVGEIA